MTQILSDLAGQGGLLLALVRATFVIALFVSYGTALFRCRLAPPALRAMGTADAVRMIQLYRRATLIALVVALGLLCVWLVVQSGAMAETGNLVLTFRTVPTVLASTSFGHTALLQAAALAAALAIVLFRKPVSETFAFAAFFAGFCVVLQAWHGHAAAMYDGFSPLLLCEILHLLAASAWLGSLLPLLLMVRRAPVKPAQIAARRYGSFGTACVVTLVLAASYQGYVLIGSVDGLVGTPYGWLVLVKLSLLLLLLGFAALNRYRFAHEAKMAHLGRSIVVETILGLVVVMAASTLVMLPPSMHM